MNGTAALRGGTEPAREGIMATSFAGFALVWGAFCLAAGALVTEAMLRAARRQDGAEPPETA